MVKKLLLAVAFCCYVQYGYTQNIGINATGALPDISAGLDVSFTSKGFLAPRVALTAANAAGPIATPATGLLVYNTATAGIAPDNVVPGYYYNGGTPAAPIWRRLATTGAGDAWTTLGNAGTAPATNFIGTTDLQAFRVRTNNAQRFEFTTNGRLRSFSNGSAGAPSYSWTSDANIGMYRIGTDILGFATTGIERVRIIANGNVGIGNAAPAHRVDIIGLGGSAVDLKVSGRIWTNSTSGGMWLSDTQDGFMGNNGANIGFWTSGVSWNAFQIVKTTGNVGIGTTAPTTRLHINGSFRLVNGTQALGRVLTSDANGVGTWQVPYAGGDKWDLLGNAGTVATTNFLGTTDAVALRIRTGNIERFEFTTNGRLRSFNTGSAGAPTYSWTVDPDIGMYRITTNVLGFSTTALERMRILANGKVAVNATATFATSTLYSFGSGNNNALDGNVAGSGDAVYGQNTGTGMGVTGLSTSATGFGMAAYNTNATGTAIITSGNNVGPSYLTAGSGGAFNGSRFGLFARASVLANGNAAGEFTVVGGPWARIASRNSTSIHYGGYFDSGNGAYSYVAYRTGTTNYKIIGIGSVSTIIKDNKNEARVMFCPEAPEPVFMDFGSGQLINGKAQIAFDPILSKNISVSEKNPLRVIVQLEGDCNGVYVTNKNNNGFEVVELNGGASNIPFTWFISAKRANEYDNNGGLLSEYEDLRFPQAPEKLQRAESATPLNNVQAKELILD